MFLTKKISKKTGVQATLLFLPFVFTASAVLADPWVGPTQAPPLGNVAAPINDSGTAQLKAGGLSLGSLIVNGGSVLNGNVGIGTTTAGRPFEISSATTPIIRLRDTGGAGIDSNTYIEFYNTVGRTGYIGRASTNGLWIRNEDASPIMFGTSNLERMRILANGNVGIGAVVPTQKLHVDGRVLIDVNSAGTQSDLAFSSNAVIGGGTGSLSVAMPGSSYFRILTGATGITGTANTGGTAGSTERLRVTSTGNVGIGTTAPAAKLDVRGTILGGEVSVVNGALILGGYYSGSHIPNTLGAHFGTAGTVLGYAVKPRNGASGYVSSASNVAWGRGAINIDSSGFHVLSGPAQSVAIDSPVSMTEKLTVLQLGNVGIGNAFPTYNLDVTGDVNYTGDLYKNGVLSNPASKIDDLSDGAYSDNSLYLGTNAGNEGAETLNRTNTGVGHNVLNIVTTGAQNTALGYTSQRLLTTGTQNTALGFYTLREHTTGSYNTAIGSRALQFNTTANYNTATGYYALYLNTDTGRNNTANGANALRFNTTGYHNSALGYGALYDNTTGIYNLGLGSHALVNNTTGANNSASGGYATMYYNTTGSHNAAYGYAALYKNTTGNYNAAFGKDALYNATTASNNTAVGYRASFGNTTGISNTTLGMLAGDNITTGSTNIVIGASVDAPSGTASNQINIGNVFKKTATGVELAGGNVGIGTSSPSQKLHVDGNILTSGNLLRSSAHTGHMVGASSSASTSPIYTLGNTYNPAATTLSNMYGIGYSHAQSTTFIPSTLGTGWGQYVAADGDARIFMSGSTGTIGVTGTPTLAQHLTTKAYVDTAVAAGTGFVETDPTAIKDFTPGDYEIASGINSSGYTAAALEVRELNHAGAQTGALAQAPRISFHWGGRVANQIGMDATGTIRTFNNPGTGYAPFAASSITANGAIIASGNVTGATPTAATHLTTKAYVDTAVAGAVDTDWTISGSNVYRNTGNVGIGTTTPAATLDVNGNARVGVLQFKGVSGDSGSAVTGYGIYQESGAWVNPYPDLVIGYHTGIKIGAVPGYGGTRFYNNAPGLAGATEIFSVGDGDNNVRVVNDLHVGGDLYKNGALVSSVSAINDLSDGGAESGSVYLGLGAGNIGVQSASRFNTGIGTDALNVPTTGYYNSAVGHASMRLLTTGYQNTAVGFYSMRTSTTGILNAALGSHTLEQNTGNYNAGVGAYALQLGTGNGNTALGYRSLQSQTIGASNVAVGAQALTANTTGYYNVGVGRYALDLNTTGTGSTAVGHHALGSNNGSHNTAVGYQAAFQNTSGIQNTAVGSYRPLYANTTGSYNVALGPYPLYTNSTGAGNIAAGYTALYRNTTGSYNVALGYEAGRYTGVTPADNNATGGNSIFLGYRARSLANGQTNQIVIGHDAVGAGSNTVTIGNDAITQTVLKGNLSLEGQIRRTATNKGYQVGSHNIASISATPAHTEPIFTMGTSYLPDVETLGNMYGIGWTYANNASFITLAGATGWGQYVAADGDARIFLSGSTGNIYATGFVYGSDRRLKENIIPIENSLDKIMQLEGVNFNWKESGKYSVGLIAQNVEKVFPELVSTSESEEGLKAVEYGNLVAPLIEAIKEQQGQIEELKREVELLKKK